MFYSAHLLSRRSKGKLAPCWLAAMNNTSTFKKYYNVAAIKKIDIAQICEEILEAVQLRNNKRFSLHLSSQLMYGTTRLFSYQVEYYQKELFEIWKIFNNIKKLNKPEESFSVVRAIDTLPEIELPLMKLKLTDHQMKEDLHILAGEIPDDALKILMQDATCLNFGILTNEELDLMLKHDSDNALHMSQMVQVTDDKHKSAAEMTIDVEITAEVHREMHSPCTTPKLVSKLKITDMSTEKLPSTPQKRQLRQPQIETPSKRRRISLKNIELPVADTAIDVIPAPLEDTLMLEQAQARTLSVRDMETSSQRVDINMELESLHSSLNTFLARKKKLIIDKRIILGDTVLRKWRQNTNFECREMKIPQIHRISSIDLLTRPSRYYVQCLCNLFVNNFERLYKSANKRIAPILPEYQEEVRGLQRTVDEHTGPMSSKLIDFEQLSIEQLSTVPVQTTWTMDEPSRQEMKTSMDGSLEEIDVLLEKIDIFSTTKDQTSLHSSCSTEKSQYALLTTQEVMAMLEILWHDHSYIKFSDLIPKDTYTKQDAATVFCILLEFQSQKKLILNQREFFSTLWIQKYENYSD